MGVKEGDKLTYKGRNLLKEAIEDLDDFNLDLKIKYGETKVIMDTCFLNLVGKEVFVDFGNGEGVMGVAMLLSNTKSNSSFQNKRKMFKSNKSDVFTGLLVPYHGLYCSSSFNTSDKYLQNKNPKYDMNFTFNKKVPGVVFIELKLEGVFEDSEVILQNRKQWIPLTQISSKKQDGSTYTFFKGSVEDLNYRILGDGIAIYKKNSIDMIFHCIPHKSIHPIVLDSKLDLIQKYIYHDKVNLSKQESIEETSGNSTFWLVLLVMLVIAGGVGTAFMILQKKKQEESEETDEKAKEIEKPLESEGTDKA
jgi:hypothetical protein